MGLIGEVLNHIREEETQGAVDRCIRDINNLDLSTIEKKTVIHLIHKHFDPMCGE